VVKGISDSEPAFTSLDDIVLTTALRLGARKSLPMGQECHSEAIALPRRGIFGAFAGESDIPLQIPRSSLGMTDAVIEVESVRASLWPTPQRTAVG